MPGSARFLSLIFASRNWLMVEPGIEYLRIMGPCTYDVCSEGEGGGWLNSDQRKGGCVDLILTREREGVKNPENLDVICRSSLSSIVKVPLQ